MLRSEQETARLVGARLIVGSNVGNCVSLSTQREPGLHDRRNVANRPSYAQKLLTSDRMR